MDKFVKKESPLVTKDVAMSKEKALDIVCEVAIDWAGEYGFVMPALATEVFQAVEILIPGFCNE